MILAHQGDSSRAPSNTIAAFELAVQSGADGLETDIHWTKDGVVVVSHDDTVDRCSDGTGRICDMTLQELKALDFGYRFTPDGGRTFPYRGRGITIPTLAEVLQSFPKVRVNIDIKPRTPGSLRALVREIYDCAAHWRVLIASFHHPVLIKFRRLQTGIATSASPREAAWLAACSKVGHVPKTVPFDAWQVPARLWRLQVVSKAAVQTARLAGAKVHVWTIDDEQTMIELLHMGVDGIVTNKPVLGTAVRSRWLGKA